MVKKAVQVFFIVLLSLIVLFMGVMFLAFHGKDVVKFHKTYFYMYDLNDMESDAPDSIPQNTLVISKEKNNYGVGSIILYKNKANKYNIGKIAETYLQNDVIKVKITVAVTDEFEEHISKKDILAECDMYNANLFKFFAFLTSMTGIVGFILLPALILVILVVILIAQNKGLYGKEEHIPVTTAKHRVKKESLKDNFGANSSVKMPNKIKVSTIPDPTPEQIAQAAFEKSKQRESFVKMPEKIETSEVIPLTETPEFIPYTESPKITPPPEPVKEPVRIIKVKENEPDIEIIKQNQTEQYDIETTQMLKPPYIRTQPQQQPKPQPKFEAAPQPKPELSSDLQTQPDLADSFTELLKVVEDLEKDLEQNK